MPDSHHNAQPLAAPNVGALAPRGVASGSALDLLGPESATTPADLGGGPARKFSFGLLLRFKWTIILTALLVAGAGMAAVWTLVDLEYRAETLLEVRSRIPRVVLPTDYTGQIPQYQQYLNSQVQIIRSPTVLERAIPELKETYWYHEPPSRVDRLLGRTQRPPLERLREAIRVLPKAGTELIEISAVARSAADAAAIVNAVLNEYLRFAREQVSEEDIRMRETIKREEQKVESEISFLERKIADAEDDLGSAAPQELMTQRTVRLDTVESELDELLLELQVARDQLQQLAAAGAGDAPDDANRPAGVNYGSDAAWVQQSREVKDLERELEIARDRYGPTHPTIVRLKRGVELAQRALTERERELDELSRLAPRVPRPHGGPSAPTSASALRFEIQLMEIRRKNLEDYHRRLRSEFEEEFATARLLNKDREQLTTSKERLTAIRRRLAELEEKGKAPAMIRSIGPARAPTRPENDKRVMFSIAALLFGLGSGFMLAYLRLSLSPQVHEAAEVGVGSQGAFLGHVPLQRGRDALPPETCPFVAEAVRMARTSLLPRLQSGSGANVLQIASASPGAGKSTFAMLLARSFAQLGRRVLLVDADLRRPALAKRFQVEPQPGLLNLLQGADVSGAVRTTTIRNLSLLPAGGSISGAEGELLASGRFGELLAQWRRSYDVVIFDGPPLVGAADAAMLSRYAEGALMVVRERHCRREAVLDALATLSAAGGRLLGTVFVGSPRGPGGYGYGYGYGRYAYGGAAEPSESFAVSDEARG